MGRQAELDLIVVGGGIVGLATAVAAQDRGLEVRCFEAARPGAGQSAGRTRIFRHRHERPELVEMAVRARREWERWETRLGHRLVGDEGALVAGPDLEDHARRFETAGVESTEVDPSAQRGRSRSSPPSERPRSSTTKAAPSASATPSRRSSGGWAGGSCSPRR